MNIMKKKTKKYISIFIGGLFLLTTLISVGFGALNNNLNISSDVEYIYNGELLYDVLRKEANNGIYAREYMEDHRDSFTENPVKSIYHWYAEDNTEATTILDKWNVLFGGFCWQMLRTTDTGGVKLIYNGVPNNGQCDYVGSSKQIGTSAFNTQFGSIREAGYMYNTLYTFGIRYGSTNYSVLDTHSMTSSSNYYYGTGVTFSGGKYTLTGVTQDKWKNIYSSSNGLYTCLSTTETTCSAYNAGVYYIAGGTYTALYGFKMINGRLLDYYNTNMVLGTNYTENNGTYNLTDTTTITKSDWFNNNQNYKDYYTCGDDTTTCTTLKYITNPSSSGFACQSSSNNYIYANDFDYNSQTDTYTLNSDRYQTWTITNTDSTNLATHHYTCFNQTGTCQKISYGYYVNDYKLCYINITGGKSIEDAIDEMLYNNDVNTTDSTVKAYIDNWYSTNMTNYTSYLEDTIFCNNRSQSNSSTNGWNPNGGSLNTNMLFNRDTLTCTKNTDKFSISNNNAQLTYPVGLASYKEMLLLNNDNLRKTNQNYWLNSPHDFFYDNTLDRSYVSINFVSSTGNLDYTFNTASYGVRPVVSLKPDTKYVSGTGSKDDPYIVE